MSIRKLRAGRVPTVTASQYIGERGSIFWNEATGDLRLSDGVTPGGSPITPITLVSTTEPTVVSEGQLWFNPQTYELWTYHNGNFLPTIDVATETKLGGVKLGPGVTTNLDGQIIIDPVGLDFSFGDFTSVVGTYAADYPEVARQNVDYALLGSINLNEDIVIASTGDGVVRIIGEFSVRHTDGSFDAVLADEPVFRVTRDGQVRMLVSTQDSTTGAVSIIGSETGAFISPVNTGVMLHVTGNYASPGIPSRIYNDSQNAFAAFVARRFNGTVAAPTQVLADEEIMRISGTAHNGTNIPGTGNQRIVYRALGNQTLTNQGGSMELWATPLNTTTIAKIATVSSTGITLESGKVLTGNVTGKADTAGNADTVTNGVYTNGSYANPAWITSLAASKVGLGNVTNESKATMFTSPTFTGTTSGITATMVGLGNVTNESKATMFTSPTFTGTVAGVTATMVGLGSVENTALSTWAGSSNITTVGTLTNLSIATGGTITTPRIVINDGGIRTVNSGTTLTIDFATDSIILWTAPSGTAAITLSNYTVGATVKVIIDMTTSRDITYGIASGANSSTALDNWNGAGGGSVSIANTAVHLDYTCISALAAGCYVAVTAL